MSMEEYGIALGTSYTAIFKQGNGIVLHEPTIIAYRGNPSNGKIRAVGLEAQNMLGKTPDGTVIVSPIKDGVITDPVSVSKLLKEFLLKVVGKRFFMPKMRIVAGIPTGITVEERRIYEDIFLQLGAKEVSMVENILLTGVGLDLPITTSASNFIVNIGGGITDISAISLGGIISGHSVSVGGSMMDRALADYFLGKYNVKFGLNRVRRIKEEIGSLHNNDMTSMDFSGADITTNLPTTIEVKATDIARTLTPYYLRIADAIESIFNVMPSELLADIQLKGIYVSGGASCIHGLAKLWQEKLRVKVNIASDAEYSVILGAGKLLTDKEILSNIKSNII